MNAGGMAVMHRTTGQVWLGGECRACVKSTRIGCVGEGNSATLAVVLWHMITA